MNASKSAARPATHLHAAWACLPRSDCVSLAASFDREWLVTNGLGGFACGTIALANTRRYHGLLIASLSPPVERVVMVAKADATVRYRGLTFQLGCNEFKDGTVAPRGFELLIAFRCEDGVPVWTYGLADAVLEQRIWMADGRNTTYLTFTLRSGGDKAEIEVVPLCTYRDYHSHAHGEHAPEVSLEERGCRITALPQARAYRLLIDRGEFEAAPDWYWGFHHRAEQARGLDADEDLFRPGVFRAKLNPAQSVAVIVTAETRAPEAAAVAFRRDQERRRTLLKSAAAAAAPWMRELTLAADQFIVKRADPDGQLSGTTVIAGYPWFGDWGRDTMIALPGLALATGRSADAGAILRTFAAHVSQGMLPNRFPDAGSAPEYNTVDATLWYFHALAAYLAQTADQKLLRDLYPTLSEIIDWHRRGTRFSIHMDPDDGLLYAGESGVQLTWMDAKVGDWVVTPRTGKAVEINALWHYALTHMAGWARSLGDRRAAANHEQAAERVAGTFSDSFWFEEGGYLYDVIDTPDGIPDVRGRRVDPSLRPNQIFAVSLGTDLLDARRSRAVVDACARELLTPVGLRSLAVRDPRYVGRYCGGPADRDAAYHQGTVWSWLLGPFALAHYRVYGDAEHASTLLEALGPHVDEACVGTVSEIHDGNAPHTPRGCFAQAWSVSETLRAFHHLARSPPRSRARIAARVGSRQ